MKRLILTADDFGLSPAINQAVEIAHVRGVLTSASLMVTAPYRDDAVARAKQLPNLGVGLHLVLADGLPALPATQIGALVNSRGEFDGHMLGPALRFFFSRSCRKQLEAEIRAQFEAYVATGLRLDHVDVHKHFHLHPTISGAMIRIGLEYGMRSVRVPKEPFIEKKGRRVRRAFLARIHDAALLPWVRLLQNRLEAAAIRHNDHVFGLADTGAMTEAKVLEILEQLPDGVSEMYFHPAATSPVAASAYATHYQYEEEYRALTSAAVRQKLEDIEIRPCTYETLAAEKVALNPQA